MQRRQIVQYVWRHNLQRSLGILQNGDQGCVLRLLPGGSSRRSGRLTHHLALKEMQVEREKREREKTKEAEIAKPRLYYDLSKVWTLQGTIEKDGHLYALIMDRARPDPKTRKPYTIYEVRKGDIIESSDRPRIYKVEILDVKKNYIKC